MPGVTRRRQSLAADSIHIREGNMPLQLSTRNIGQHSSSIALATGPQLDPLIQDRSTLYQPVGARSGFHCAVQN